MAEGRPTRPRPPVHECYRLTLRQGPHQWSFTFAPDDAPALINRIRELARDPDAPLDRLYAQAARRQIRRLLAATTATRPGPGDPDPVDPTGRGRRCR